MHRSTIDRIVSWAGLVVAVVLVFAGGLMLWGSAYVGDQVSRQLTEQRIFFPPADSPAVQGPEFATVREYGGQQLTTGDQARVYADDYIGAHLADVADGQTYAQVSTAAFQDPENAALKAQADTLFRGTTLRGMLLNAAAFAQIGDLAFAGAVVSLAGGGVLLVLALLGFAHARRAERRNEAVTAVPVAPVEARKAA